MHKKRGIRSSKRRGPFCYLFVLRLLTIYFSLGNGKREPLRPPFSPNKLRDYLGRTTRPARETLSVRGPRSPP
nr:hypothetical protein Q903MT_gene5231 [Picea sitchensis]